MYDLLNKTILIFGGTGELMGNVAIGLKKNLATVIIIGRDITKAQTIKEVADVDFFEFDIMNGDLEELFDKIYQKYKYIDMLINGAGINSSSKFLEIKHNEINKIFQINFNFVVYCCQIYIKKTLELNKPGKILNIGSVSGLNPLSKVFMYSASKASLHNFSKNIAREFGDRNILTNILVPWFFPTEQNKKILSSKRTEDILNHTPIKRFGCPTELIGMVILLASDNSSFINGSELVIDGGYSVTRI